MVQKQSVVCFVNKVLFGIAMHDCTHFTWTKDFQMYKLDLEKAEEPEINCQHLLDHSKSKRIPERHLLLIHWLLIHKAFDYVDNNKLWKILQESGILITLPVSCETCMQVKKQQFEPNMEQHTGSNLGKEYVKAVYCYLAYLTYIQNASWEMLGWMKLKLESRLLGEISVTSDMQMTPL